MAKRAFSLTAVAATLGFLLHGPAPLAGQEGCELEPSDPAVEAQALIEQAHQAETPEQAEESYRQALAAVEGRLNSADAASLIMGAAAHIGLGDYERADALLDRFLEVAPGCAEPARDTRYNAWVGLFNEAITAYQQGDTETALDRFETANLIHEDPRSLNNAAFLHQQQGDTEEAIELYRRAVATDADPEQTRNALTNLANLLVAEGRAQEALGAYEEYLEDNPDDLVVRSEYALALLQERRAEEAVPIFEEVLAAEDLSNEQWNQVGVGLFNAEQYEQATVAFRKAHEANPYNKEALENLVASMIQADQQQQAEELARTLVERYPYDVANHQYLANVLAQTDRSQEALETMQAIEDAPMAFQSVQMAQSAENTYVIQGTAEGRETGAGTTMTIPFELLGPDGAVIASEEVEIQVPAAGETASFQTTIETDQEVLGFRYAKAGSDGIQE